MSYGSSRGTYHRNATHAGNGTQEPRPERKESPETTEIVSHVLLPTGRQTARFQIFEHQDVGADGLADCVIFTKNGLYIPLDHYLSTVPIEVVIRPAAVKPPTPRRKGRPAAKSTTAKVPAAKSTGRKPAAGAKAPTTVARRTRTAG